MNYTTKKRILCLIMVFAYCFGAVILPTNADSYKNDFSDESASFTDLLSQRDSQSTTGLQIQTVSALPGASHISEFTDVTQFDWYYSHLDLLVNNGIIKGKTPTTFEPDSTFSYAECSTVITR